MNNTLFAQLEEKYPFLTVCRYADEEFIGIIQNNDDTFTSIYDFGQLPSIELKELYLKLGEDWWWESNRQISINLFLKQEWRIFKPYTRTFVNKSLEILSGPVTRLNNITPNKQKRKSVILVKSIH